MTTVKEQKPYKEHSNHKMKRMMHDKGGTSPCLHCECGATWGATGRAIDYLIGEHNSKIL